MFIEIEHGTGRVMNRGACELSFPVSVAFVLPAIAGVLCYGCSKATAEIDTHLAVIADFTLALEPATEYGTRTGNGLRETCEDVMLLAKKTFSEARYQVTHIFGVIVLRLCLDGKAMGVAQSDSQNSDVFSKWLPRGHIVLTGDNHSLSSFLITDFQANLRFNVDPILLP
ncbi:unnamed protein product [Soboliphyme baturini]|uniref:DUF5683 domain-containing protein n=1 Tax=Soboliphyme baturini TaxID=241478 RepID=A0A183ITE0_9BILA|nr:unnamed protein product [Soboliphyme baturini]